MRLQDTGSSELFTVLGGIRKRYSNIMSSEGGVTGREIEEQAILAQDILRLQKREFYYFGFEGEFKGKTSKIQEVPCDIVKKNLLQEQNDSQEDEQEDKLVEKLNKARN